MLPVYWQQYAFGRAVPWDRIFGPLDFGLVPKSHLTDGLYTRGADRAMARKDHVHIIIIWGRT